MYGVIRGMSLGEDYCERTASFFRVSMRAEIEPLMLFHH